VARKKHKRSYGLGRVFQRGKIWWAEVYDGEGHKLRRSSKSENREDAVNTIAAMIRGRSRGELVAIDTPATYKGAELLDEYLQKRCKLAKKTLETYRSQIDLHLKPYFGLFRVAKITTDVMSDYRDLRAKQGRMSGSNTKEENRPALSI
jgi:hypothetical protein